MRSSWNNQYERGRHPPEQVQQPSFHWHALRALAAALDPDPAKAAWNVCWLASNAIGGNFDGQPRLAVLSRLIDCATGGR